MISKEKDLATNLHLYPYVKEYSLNDLLSMGLDEGEARLMLGGKERVVRYGCAIGREGEKNPRNFDYLPVVDIRSLEDLACGMAGIVAMRGKEGANLRFWGESEMSRRVVEHIDKKGKTDYLSQSEIRDLLTKYGEIAGIAST
jgi:hypothetical protein